VGFADVEGRKVEDGRFFGDGSAVGKNGFGIFLQVVKFV
jgi:hypothetical protein